MSWTNVRIPDPFCIENTLARNLRVKELQMKMLQEDYDRLLKSMQDMHRILEDGGHVNLLTNIGSRAVKIGKLNPEHPKEDK